MPAVKPFQMSLYLSLAVAILAMGVASADLLPEFPFATAFSLILLGIAWYLEGRWALSLHAANMVGLGLSILLLLWIVFQFVRPPTVLAELLPWPAKGLPYLVPVLMILIPAKLLRPKHMGDYWAMQGLGVLAMGLACAMAMDGLFIILFLVYAMLFVWSLVAFHVYRELGPGPGTRLPLTGGRWRGIRSGLMWAAVCGAAAVPMFWLTPRTGKEWELAINARGKATTGVSDGPVDLNRTGLIEVNEERAFEFFASTPDGQPVLNFPSEQRFRSTHLHNYEGGRWVRNQFTFQTADRAYSPPGVTRDPRSRMPDLGPSTVHLTFVLNPRLTRTPPLADPVAWQCGVLSPAASRYEDGSYRSWVHRHDGSLDGAFNFDSGSPQYLQAWAPPSQPGYAPVMRIQPGRTEYLTRLPRNLTGLKDFTNQSIERLVKEEKLPKEVLTDLDPDTLARKPIYHEAIARALEQYLAHSGDFVYTLELTRGDRSIDPVEDFVLNTRAGHCQRFATALVLMLRTQGIPSQMVIGYRGCEGRGDGWYDVREADAHAWVEVLTPASDEGLMPVWYISQSLGQSWNAMRWQMVFGGSAPGMAFELPPDWKPMRWITFDPTPSLGSEGANNASSFWDLARQKWEALMKVLLLAYNGDSREQAISSIQSWLVDENGRLYLSAGLVGAIAFWWARRRSRHRAEFLAGYPDYMRRLGGLLAKAGLVWHRGQTAREVATLAQQRLAEQPDVATIPVQIVEAYYSERFGGLPLDTVQRSELNAGLVKLSGALSRLA